MVTQEQVTRDLRSLYEEYLKRVEKTTIEKVSFEYWLLVNFVIPESDTNVSLVNAQNEIETLKREIANQKFEIQEYEKKVRDILETLE